MRRLFGPERQHAPFAGIDKGLSKNARSDTGPVPPTSGTLWGLPAGARLLWQTWDDEVIVFNTASGQTHLLDVLSAAALEEIERRPGTIDQLSGRLADRFKLDTGALSRRLAIVCARFDELGLAEPRQS